MSDLGSRDRVGATRGREETAASYSCQRAAESKGRLCDWQFGALVGVEQPLPGLAEEVY